jgi:hypothetical protein
MMTRSFVRRGCALEEMFNVIEEIKTAPESVQREILTS